MLTLKMHCHYSPQLPNDQILLKAWSISFLLNSLSSTAPHDVSWPCKVTLARYKRLFLFTPAQKKNCPCPCWAVQIFHYNQKCGIRVSVRPSAPPARLLTHRMVPLNRMGSCRMMEKRDRSVCRGIWAMSIPSMMMRPGGGRGGISA